MTVQIDTTAEIDAVRLKTEPSHPSAPSAGHVLLYFVTGTAVPGLYTELSNGQKIGPFITGSSSSGGSSVLVQKVGVETGAVETGNTVIPFDDTIPQNSEGDEYMTLTITPTNASNILYITTVVQMSYSVAAWHAIALFQDSGANALAAIVQFQATPGGGTFQTLTHKMTAGTTSSTTFKVRAGGQTAGTTTFNGQNTGRIYGGIMASSIVIEEVTP
jgi:hypothetical protein